ncbi:hypothetical protein AQI95_02105 [Streptomyces yokosukanensis]|uniref:Uncharacterized protein n=1 Tax=Streptomyces yokosukanensis TaxID=67386 RepID=A0A101PFG3_9ACTN|nr:hypothetical protein [Streptomyces yokosukanensis]KUN10525.1 hypothetical protein AQI95_02105 [Streptomyces yokosukanensis]
MSDHNGLPQRPDPRAWGAPQQVPEARHTPPAAQVPVVAQAVEAAQVPQVFTAEHAWVDGYEPGNPWQARLCVQTPYGIFAHPLTPNTIPELLEQMVLVAQEQQGLPVGLDADPAPEAQAVDAADEEEQSLAVRFQSGRAARVTGWAVVHDLWEREDPTARIVMGAIVVVLLLLGIFLT